MLPNLEKKFSVKKEFIKIESFLKKFNEVRDISFLFDELFNLKVKYKSMRNDPNIKDNNFTLYLFMNIHVFYLSQLHREIRKNNFYSKKDLTEENVKEIIKIIDELVEKQNMFVSIFNGFLLGYISNDELLSHIDEVLGGDGNAVAGLSEMIKNMNDVLSGKIDEEEYQRRIEAIQSENIENEKNNNDDVENNLNEKTDEKNNIEDSVEIENNIESSEINENVKNIN